MEKFNLTNNIRKWYPFAYGYTKGFAFIDDRFLTERQLYDECIFSIENNILKSFLENLNGNFCILLFYKSKYYLIVDKLRSFPLFYTFDSKGIEIITDIGQDIARITKNNIQFNKNAVNELLSKGYLSGNKTLVNNIFQVEAGTCVVIEGFKIDIKRYYMFIINKKNYEKVYLFEKAKNALENGFKRIITSIENKPVLIPLSGGYDSRLIACLCKKFYLENVTCFTYGRPNSLEVINSKNVAEKLGFKWFYIEYDKAKWSQYLNSEDYKKYAVFAGNITSVPHFQDFIALQELINKKLVSNNSIVMPGHSGDLLGGSKIPKIIKEERKFIMDSDLLMNLIYDEFYNLNSLKKPYKRELLQDIKTQINEYYFSEVNFLDIYEQIFITSKVSNFLVNSMRGYEYFNLEWRLPLWDDEYSHFWHSIEWEKKYFSKLYNEFMFTTYFDPLKVNFLKEITLTQTYFVSRFKKYLPMGLTSLHKKMVFMKSNIIFWKKEKNAFDDVIDILFDEKDNKRYTSVKRIRKEYMDAINALDYLKRVEKNLKIY